MDYSTFNKRNFFIKKDSTLPILRYPLIQQVREKYNITDDMLENVAVTFSMINTDNGMYRIANISANLVIVEDNASYPDDEKYTLTYKFTLNQTAKVGRYSGEFKIDFLDEESGCGKITLPVDDLINIIISDSITKTTVI